jgi:NAD(P)H dehydrogenase (quinone)
MILVLGATGSIGRHLVRQLRDRGEPVRAFVRDAAKGRALGVEYAVGDLDDPPSVAAALAGVDRLLLNAGGAVPADGEQPMVRQQKAAIDAAVAAGVDRVVKISVLGAERGGRLASGAHWDIERHLAASGLTWSVLRPSGFMQNFVTGTGSFTDDGDLLGAYGDGRVSYVDCADIAACAAALLTGPARPGATFTLTGPEAFTHTEIAVLLSHAWGRRVRYVDLPPDAFAARLAAQGLPAGFATDVAALFAAAASGAMAAVTTDVHDLTGRPPRGLADFLATTREPSHPTA